MRIGPRATIVWFRQDLRLQDNPALFHALARGGPVLPVYILDEAGEGMWPAGAASRWWLHRSLASLDESLRTRGSRLLLVKGDSGVVIKRLLRETGAAAVHWSRRYEPASIVRDKVLKSELTAAGVEALCFNSALLFEPPTVRNKSGDPFRVFTPFWRHCLTLPVAAPVELPRGPIPAPTRWPRSLLLPELGLNSTTRWDAGPAARWRQGEAGARERLKNFSTAGMSLYAAHRDLPAVDGTALLSPHLHWGEIGPRQIWAAVRARSKGTGIFPPSRGAQLFLGELGWREFAHHLLYHFPQMPEQPLRPELGEFPWEKYQRQLKAWQTGQTGYPIVDAGMRQLWQTGWMHNRVRMIVASFLVKHLRISWCKGARWFWDNLMDADLANNSLGWQWVAGCGVDAAPFFRIFNPVTQGRRFDATGAYIRRWVPELAQLTAGSIHQPWLAEAEELEQAGVLLGKSYPRPLVDHAAAREAALSAWRDLRKLKPGKE